MDAIEIWAILAALPNICDFANVGLLYITLDHFGRYESRFLWEVLHIMRFSRDVPDQAVIVFRLGSQQLHVLPDTLCRLGELFQLSFREEGTCGTHHPLEVDGVLDELVY